MDLRAERITSQTAHAVEDVYRSSFPENERVPFWQLRLLAHRRCADFFVFFDGNAFCGLAYLVYGEGLTYVFYLATNANVRSKGYGSAMLAWIARHTPDAQTVLEIETVADGFDNTEQRRARQRFYFKNGFRDTGFKMNEQGIVYDILCTAGDFDPDRLVDAIRRYSFGLGKMEIYPAQE